MVGSFRILNCQEMCRKPTPFNRSSPEEWVLQQSTCLHFFSTLPYGRSKTFSFGEFGQRGFRSHLRRADSPSLRPPPGIEHHYPLSPGSGILHIASTVPDHGVGMFVFLFPPGGKRK